MSPVRSAARVEVLGIRHHGPGSARAVASTLDELRPDAVLIEGPADADPLVGLVGEKDLAPPVALLAYAPDSPGTSAFWPFAVFSPEWQALRWAAEHGVPVRFCDLPASAVLAADPDPPDAPEEPAAGRAREARADPLALLASAAGYPEPERWWDDVVESRVDGVGAFAAITEAMTELRATVPPPGPVEARREERREAYMRTVLRRTISAGADRVAIVCGAWHAPALAGPLPTATADAAVLKGLPKRKVATTWVPWTHSRLGYASGYGAGIESPGWYHHLFTSPDQVVVRWLTRVAGVLRAEDLPVSSAHVIEAVRLAETLATLRQRPLAGLAEATDATRAVLCDGDETALALVTSRLVVGEALGRVPASAPTVPLEGDLRKQARRLRLKIEATDRRLDLDLRKPTDLGRSRLLHRLSLLEINWGVLEEDVRGTGTFRETWDLVWQPELSVAVIAAAMWGTTVRNAATAVLADLAVRADTLPRLTTAVEQSLLADLPEALPGLLAAVDARAAVDADLGHLMDAIPALVRALRYGDVRGTDTAALTTVADSLLLRVCAGLPVAVTGLDADGARDLRDRIDALHSAVALRDDAAAKERWLGTLAGLIQRDDVPGLVAGRMTRLLSDAGRLGPDGAEGYVARALSIGPDAATKAAWVEGFLSGGGLLLVHDPALLGLLDGWVAGLPPDEFVAVLPLLRRTFGQFADGERRGIGEQVRHLRSGPAAPPGDAWPFDPGRGGRAAATVADLLGVRWGGDR